mgnify:CR=1 FL=1
MADADKDLDINPQAKGGGTDRNIRSVAVTPGQFGIGKIPATDVTGLARRGATDYGKLTNIMTAIKDQEAYEKEKLDALIFDNNAIKNASEMKQVYEDMTSKKAIEEMGSQELETYEKNLRVIMKTRYDHKYRDKSQKEKLTWGPVFEKTLIALEKPMEDERKKRATIESKKNSDDKIAVIFNRLRGLESDDIVLNRKQFINELYKKELNDETVNYVKELERFDTEAVIGLLEKTLVSDNNLNVLGDELGLNESRTDYSKIETLISTKKGLVEFINDSGNYVVRTKTNTNAKGHLIDEKGKEILDDFGDPIETLNLTPNLMKEIRETINKESDDILKNLKAAAFSHNKKELAMATNEAIKITNNTELDTKTKKDKILALLDKYTIGEEAIVFKDISSTGNIYQKALITQLKNIAKHGVLTEQTDTGLYDRLEALLYGANQELLNKGAFYRVNVKVYKQVPKTKPDPDDPTQQKMIPVLNDKGEPVTERKLVTQSMTLLELENFQTKTAEGDVIQQGLTSDQLQRILDFINNPNIKSANKEQNNIIDNFIKDNVFETLGLSEKFSLAKQYYTRRFKEGLLGDIKNKVGTLDNKNNQILLNTILYDETSVHYWKKQDYSQPPTGKEAGRKELELLNSNNLQKGKGKIKDTRVINVVGGGQVGPLSGFGQPGLKTNNISKGNSKITADKLPAVHRKLINYINNNPNLKDQAIKAFVERYGKENLPKELK